MVKGGRGGGREDRAKKGERSNGPPGDEVDTLLQCFCWFSVCRCGCGSGGGGGDVKGGG